MRLKCCYNRCLEVVTNEEKKRKQSCHVKKIGFYLPRSRHLKPHNCKTNILQALPTNPLIFSCNLQQEPHQNTVYCSKIGSMFSNSSQNMQKPHTGMPSAIALSGMLAITCPQISSNNPKNKHQSHWSMVKDAVVKAWLPNSTITT